MDLTFIVHFLCLRGHLKLCLASHTFVYLQLMFSTTQSITRHVLYSYCIFTCAILLLSVFFNCHSFLELLQVGQITQERISEYIAAAVSF